MISTDLITWFFSYFIEEIRFLIVIGVAGLMVLMAYMGELG